jgi:hypothetical protein
MKYTVILLLAFVVGALSYALDPTHASDDWTLDWNMTDVDSPQSNCGVSSNYSFVNSIKCVLVCGKSDPTQQKFLLDFSVFFSSTEGVISSKSETKLH